MRNSYKVLVAKPEEVEGPLEGSRRRWEGDIKLGLKETVGDDYVD
jgi:hypothetical protein